ncbi:MAG: NHL repeat-containing protein [Acidobacteria bacterium]|nr:NHL repeat-containing protein [Acidobacteriota bacterium]
MRNRYLKIQTQLLYILFFCIFFPLHGQSSIIANNLKDIDACEDKIKLTLVRVWGDEDTEDENQLFRCPGDIKIDAQGRIYILDSGNHRVQVFDQNGKFLRSIGKRGQGPADMLAPSSISFTSNNNIVISDTFNYRLQVFNPEGKYIQSFRMDSMIITRFCISSKDELLLYLPKNESEKKWALSFFDLQGNWKKDILILPCHYEEHTYWNKNDTKTVKECAQEPILHSMNDKGDIFMSYSGFPAYQKLAGNGQLLATITYEVPYDTFKINLPPNSIIPQVSRSNTEIKQRPLADFSCDRKGNVFLVANDRLLAKKETYYITGPGERFPNDFPEKTDLHRLLIFDSNGKAIASKKLPVFCDRVYLYDNRLFIIDQYRLMMIYEYKYEL